MVEAITHNSVLDIMDRVPQEEVFQLILEGKSYKEISDVLQQRYSHIRRGFSERSVRRYVTKAGLKSKQKAVLTEEVRVATQEVSYIVDLSTAGVQFLYIPMTSYHMIN